MATQDKSTGSESSKRVPDDQKAMADLCGLPVDFFNPEATRDAWKVYDRYTPTKNDSKRGRDGSDKVSKDDSMDVKEFTESLGVSDSDDESDRLPKKGRKEASPIGRSQNWSTILNMHSLSRPEYLVLFLNRPADQISGEKFVLPDINDRPPLPRISSDPNQDLRTAPRERVNYTLALVGRLEDSNGTHKINAFQCFNWLMWYDIVKSIKPDTTGARIGKDVKVALEKLLNKMHSNRVNKAEIKFSQVDGWIKKGRKINHLCEKFGEGSVLLLADKLSENFVIHRFSMQGEQHDKAIEHLTRLGLHAMAQEEDVKQLGEDIRRHLFESYQHYIQK